MLLVVSKGTRTPIICANFDRDRTLVLAQWPESDFDVLQAPDAIYRSLNPLTGISDVAPESATILDRTEPLP